MASFSQEYKLADYFSVIGLDDHLSNLDQSTEGNNQSIIVNQCPDLHILARKYDHCYTFLEY